MTLVAVSDFRDKDQVGAKLNVQIDEVEGDSYTYHAYDEMGKRREGQVKKK